MEKVYFYEGDIVMLKQDVANKPESMVVKSVDKSLIKNDSKNSKLLKGIRCFWFTNEGIYQEALFSSKDLVRIKSYADFE